jgi:hypothetical protein
MRVVAFLDESQDILRRAVCKRTGVPLTESAMGQLLKTTARRRRSASQVAFGLINKAKLLRAALFEDRPVNNSFVSVRAFARAVAPRDVKQQLCDRRSVGK